MDKLPKANTKIETLETENTAIKARLDALEAEWCKIFNQSVQNPEVTMAHIYDLNPHLRPGGAPKPKKKATAKEETTAKKKAGRPKKKT